MNTAPVHCLHTDIWPIEKFVSHPRNPNFHPDAQIALLAKIIVTNGWRSPIAVSARSGYITRGHGRLYAARRAGLKECPVDIQKYESVEDELADMVADNRISELSEMDPVEVTKLLEEIQASGVDLDVAGYTQEAMKALGMVDEPDAPKQRNSNRRVGATIRQYNIVFDDDIQQQQWFAFLKFLRTRFPEAATIASRLSKCIADTPNV
jgi:hypothetical protein